MLTKVLAVVVSLRKLECAEHMFEIHTHTCAYTLTHLLSLYMCLLKRNTVPICMLYNNKYRKVFPHMFEGHVDALAFSVVVELSHSICIIWVCLCMCVRERKRAPGYEHAHEYRSNFKVKIHTSTKHTLHITGWHLNLIQSMQIFHKYVCLWLWPQTEKLTTQLFFFATQEKL